jgi:hypothetical protein
VLLVAVAHKEVGVELAQVEAEMPNPMRAVHERQHPELFTHAHQPLERQSEARHAHNGIKDRDPHHSAALLLLLYRRSESVDDDIIARGKLDRDLYADRGRGLLNVLDAVLARVVDKVEIDDAVAGLEDERAQDGVDAGGGIGDEDELGEGHVEVCGEEGARAVEQRGVSGADELVGALLGGGLEGLEGAADGAGVRAEGACGRELMVRSDWMELGDAIICRFILRHPLHWRIAVGGRFSQQARVSYHD